MNRKSMWKLCNSIVYTGRATELSIKMYYFFSDEDEDGDRITVRSDEEMKSMFQTVGTSDILNCLIFI